MELEVFLIQFEDGLGFGRRTLLKVPKPSLRVKTVTKKAPQRLLYKTVSELFLFRSHAMVLVTNSADACFAKLERLFFPTKLQFVFLIKR